ncbi:orotidine-5'-phosphate decarboxylase [Ktedonosporobacter rubrisoli]|uniref:Orotidine 5'-phosphate decarboxylase n=2 Tax=Ktedonosporobacter rubrisoli TaxID=2509675 RepID=A0A4P6K5U5_KTERU|nr:orotidine-5'-phosphate decarboxylase [Ktedonosporobacter rubrisoli]
MLEQRWQQGKFVCVGLDSDYERLPAIAKRAGSVEEAIFVFNREIIDATHDLVCAYKPNSAFYEAQGEDGLRALARTVRYIKERYAAIPVILDAKRADIGSTNHGYVSSAFDHLGVDAITVHPYLGKEALAPFLERKEKGIIVLAKTSNPGAGELQDLPVGEAREPLYQVVARHIASDWNAQGNCALVIGATYPADLAKVRALIGDMPILIPGIGAQGGEIAATVTAGKDSRGWGMIINSSRGIIYASHGDDFAGASRQATEQLSAEISRQLSH